MHDYEHTQPGTFIRVWVGLWVIVFATAAAVMLASGSSEETAIVFSAIAAMLAICVALFHSLTVRVSRNDIVLSFGVGIIQKSFLIDDIQTAAILRNR
ncbi:hypothetical protein HQ563_02485 [bacterium]|nr:hypothetical protein [bacterium]